MSTKAACGNVCTDRTAQRILLNQPEQKWDSPQSRTLCAACISSVPNPFLYSALWGGTASKESFLPFSQLDPGLRQERVQRAHGQHQHRSCFFPEVCFQCGSTESKPRMMTTESLYMRASEPEPGKTKSQLPNIWILQENHRKEGNRQSERLPWSLPFLKV